MLIISGLSVAALCASVTAFAAPITPVAADGETRPAQPRGLAHRLFVYDGFFVNSYLRYWPNVWSSQNEVSFGSGLTHDPLDLGLFANISVGYAIDLSSGSKTSTARR